jgi:hypothetical protein
MVHKVNIFPCFIFNTQIKFFRVFVFISHILWANVDLLLTNILFRTRYCTSWSDKLLKMGATANRLILEPSRKVLSSAEFDSSQIQ